MSEYVKFLEESRLMWMKMAQRNLILAGVSATWAAIVTVLYILRFTK